MVDCLRKREDYTGWASRDDLSPVGIIGVGEHGMVGRYVHERGIPPWFSRMRVPFYKRKSEEDGMTVEGVGGAIVPTNRVTTGEGRAPGQDCPWKGNGER